MFEIIDYNEEAEEANHTLYSNQTHDLDFDLNYVNNEVNEITKEIESLSFSNLITLKRENQCELIDIPE